MSWDVLGLECMQQDDARCQMLDSLCLHDSATVEGQTFNSYHTIVTNPSCITFCLPVRNVFFWYIYILYTLISWSLWVAFAMNSPCPTVARFGLPCYLGTCVVQDASPRRDRTDRACEIESLADLKLSRQQAIPGQYFVVVAGWSQAGMVPDEQLKMKLG